MAKRKQRVEKEPEAAAVEAVVPEQPVAEALAPVPEPSPAPAALRQHQFVKHVETGLVGYVESFDEGGRTFVVQPVAYVNGYGVPSRIGDPCPPQHFHVAVFVPFI